MRLTYVIKDLKINCQNVQKTNQTEFKAEKVIKRIIDKLHVKWKGYDKSFHGWIDEKHIRLVKPESYLSNYATKIDLKNVADVVTSKFAKMLI